MKQNKCKGAVLKGLAFPIGYFVFMNIFQTAAVMLYSVYCACRDIFIPIASAADSTETFLELLSDAMASEAYQRYLTEIMPIELSGAPTYAISVLTSILAIVILWLVFNRKNRDFKEYFSFKRASVSSIFSAICLGLGFYFIVNFVFSLITYISNIALLEWVIPMLRDRTAELLQQGQDDLAYT